MTLHLILYLCGAAVIISGLVAGVFLAFSDFVMKSLATASPLSGIESMQLINRNVYGSVFLMLLMSMAAISLFLAVFAYFLIAGPASLWIFAGGTLYVIGVFLVTMIFNVPLNKRLDALDHKASETESFWVICASTWTLWNHVRTIAAAGSTTCFFVGCLLLNPDLIAL